MNDFRSMCWLELFDLARAYGVEAGLELHYSCTIGEQRQPVYKDTRCAFTTLSRLIRSLWLKSASYRSIRDEGFVPIQSSRRSLFPRSFVCGDPGSPIAQFTEGKEQRYNIDISSRFHNFMRVH